MLLSTKGRCKSGLSEALFTKSSHSLDKLSKVPFQELPEQKSEGGYSPKHALIFLATCVEQRYRPTRHLYCHLNRRKFCPVLTVSTIYKLVDFAFAPKIFLNLCMQGERWEGVPTYMPTRLNYV